MQKLRRTTMWTLGAIHVAPNNRVLPVDLS